MQYGLEAGNGWKIVTGNCCSVHRWPCEVFASIRSYIPESVQIFSGDLHTVQRWSREIFSFSVGSKDDHVRLVPVSKGRPRRLVHGSEKDHVDPLVQVSRRHSSVYSSVETR